MDGLLAESDVLTIHVDGRDSNHGLLDAGIIGRLKTDVILLNTSRGFVIEDALADWLRFNPTALAIRTSGNRSPRRIRCSAWPTPMPAPGG